DDLKLDLGISLEKHLDQARADGSAHRRRHSERHGSTDDASGFVQLVLGLEQVPDQWTDGRLKLRSFLGQSNPSSMPVEKLRGNIGFQQSNGTAESGWGNAEDCRCLRQTSDFRDRQKILEMPQFHDPRHLAVASDRRTRTYAGPAYL